MSELTLAQSAVKILASRCVWHMFCLCVAFVLSPPLVHLGNGTGQTRCTCHTCPRQSDGEIQTDLLDLFGYTGSNVL